MGLATPTAVAALCAAALLAPARVSAQGDSTVLITLGTGGPNPTPGHAGPATAVVRGSLVLLFDAVHVYRRCPPLRNRRSALQRNATR